VTRDNQREHLFRSLDHVRDARLQVTHDLSHRVVELDHLVGMSVDQSTEQRLRIRTNHPCVRVIQNVKLIKPQQDRLGQGGILRMPMLALDKIELSKWHQGVKPVCMDHRRRPYLYHATSLMWLDRRASSLAAVHVDRLRHLLSTACSACVHHTRPEGNRSQGLLVRQPSESTECETLGIRRHRSLV
jgi:hypothetical protein